jgi:HSP20 family protein
VLPGRGGHFSGCVPRIRPVAAALGSHDDSLESPESDRRVAMNMLSTRRTGRAPTLWGRDPFATLREEMNDLRARFFGNGEEDWVAGTMVPALDVSETDTAIDVRMDVPGITAKDIDIQINGNLLTVSGERKEEKEEKGKTFHRIERSCGNFSRSVTLPCSVAESEVAAEYHDGVLTIKLPKKEESKAHKVKVKG